MITMTLEIIVDQPNLENTSLNVNVTGFRTVISTLDMPNVKTKMG